jgi:hypothetical protein
LEPSSDDHHSIIICYFRVIFPPTLPYTLYI